MTRGFPKKLSFLLLIAAVCTLAAYGLWLRDQEAVADPISRRPVTFPELFSASAPCPEESKHREVGARLEERARLRADRYAYDPRDGVLSVRRYRQAAACHNAAGDEVAASRARALGTVVSARIEADYAAARLNLVNALEREQWKAALAIIQRLRRLTDQVGRSEYVDWLDEIEGRVAARASSAP